MLVFKRSIHPELYLTESRRAFAIRNWRVRVGLCLDGHVIEYRSKNLTLTEFVTTAGGSLPPSHRLLDESVVGTRHESIPVDSGTTIHLAVQSERLERGPFEKLQQEFAIDSRKARIAQTFHEGHGAQFKATSHIFVDALPNAVVSQCFHTFPGEESVIRTQFLIEQVH